MSISRTVVLVFFYHFYLKRLFVSICRSLLLHYYLTQKIQKYLIRCFWVNVCQTVIIIPQLHDKLPRFNWSWMECFFFPGNKELQKTCHPPLHFHSCEGTQGLEYTSSFDRMLYDLYFVWLKSHFYLLIVSNIIIIVDKWNKSKKYV